MTPTPSTPPTLEHLEITDHSTGARLKILVKPKAPRTQILTITDGALKVALAAPPVDGEANLALSKSLAKWLALPASSITIQTGQRSKHKLLHFAGLTAKQLREKLEAYLCPQPPP